MQIREMEQQQTQKKVIVEIDQLQFEQTRTINT